MSHNPNTTIATITTITNATFIIILINNMHCNYSCQFYLSLRTTKIIKIITTTYCL